MKGKIKNQTMVIVITMIVFMIGCEPAGNSSDPSTSATQITGTFSYGTGNIYVQKGTALAAAISPTWDGNETAKQLDEGNIEYSIAPTDAAKQAFASTGLDFSTSTGAISSTAADTPSTTEYTITAIGKGEFAGTLTATFKITITEKPPITGTFNYGTGKVYVQKSTELDVAISPIWDGSEIAKQLDDGNIAYSIAPTDFEGQAFVNTGLDFNTSTGAISGTTTDTPITTEYTITATGKGEFAGMLTTTFKITITEKPPITGTFSYGTGNISVQKGTALASAISPTWDGNEAAKQLDEGNIAYSIAPTNSFASTGLDFDASTGAISGTTADTPSTTEYTITATGKGAFDGTLTTTFKITITENPPITGTFSYRTGNISIQKGTTLVVAISPTWDGGQTAKQLDEGNIAYSITPTDSEGQAFASTGLDFDTSTGVISGTAADTPSTTEYTITATGRGTFDGEIIGIVHITIVSALTGNFTYVNITGTKGTGLSDNTYLPNWEGNNIKQTVSYAINTTPASELFNFKDEIGLDFNIATGEISGKPTKTQTSTEYTITATGTGLYTGSKTTRIMITIEASLIGTISYTNGNITGIKDSTITENQLEWSKDAPEDIVSTVTYAINTTPAKELFNFNTATGLDFDDKTGTISGKLTVLHTSTSYIVTATPAPPYTGNTSVTIQIEVTTPITGIFSYDGAIAGTKDTALTDNQHVPTWKERVDENQTVNYAINTTPATESFNFKTATGLDFNTATGEISGTPTELQTSTNYIITATAIAPYTDPAQKITATVQIAITAPITGSFSYDAAIAGTKDTTLPDNTHVPTWKERVDENQTVSYAINTTPATESFNFKDATGLDFDTVTGEISGTPTKPQTSTSYTITATAIAPYTDPDPRITATVQIAITAPLTGTFSYGTGTAYVQKNNALDTTISPTWENAKAGQLDTGNIEYSIASTDSAGQAFTSTGLDFDANTGAINGTAADTSSTTEYIITATAKAPYTDPAEPITATVQIIITELPPITGTFSYASANILAIKDSAITKTISATWDGGEAANQLDAGNIEYSIAPKKSDGTAFATTGLTLNSTNGVISGTPTSTVKETYIVTATGKTNFAGEITYDIHIEVYETQVHLLGYRAVVYGSTDTSSPIFGFGSVPTDSSFTLASTRENSSATLVPTLPTINGTTGSIAVTNATTAGTYKITVDAAAFASEVIADFYVTNTPTTISELESALETGIKNFGNTADYNYIQTGSKTSMRGAFSKDYKDGVFSSNVKGFVTNFNGDISKWDTSATIDMEAMFRAATNFDQDINTKIVIYINDGGVVATYTAWDTGMVENMSGVFDRASVFNGDVSNWNTSAVTTMENMFSGAVVFNKDINTKTVTVDGTIYTAWDTRAITNMRSMFSGATAFNGDISNWDTGMVEDMSGVFDRASIFNGDVSNWNTSAVTTMENMFYEAVAFNKDINTKTVTVDGTTYTAWDTRAITNMRSMFSGATAFNGDISNWDTGMVEDMSGVFDRASVFNGDVSNWNTSAVENMEAMFSGAIAFNGDISSWDTSKVTTMENMFSGAVVFNKDINTKTVTVDGTTYTAWDTSAVTKMNMMFFGATAFNGDISNWNTSEVTTIQAMFFRVTKFNKDINTKIVTVNGTTYTAWDTSKVTNMDGTFRGAKVFNSNISNWDTSAVTTMRTLFFDAEAFNGNISNWNTSAVWNMANLFEKTEAFNGNISGWNTSAVKDMSGMFLETTAFNGDISIWDVSQVTTMSRMFFRAERFTQNLDAWSTKLKSGVIKTEMFLDSGLDGKEPSWY